MIANVKQLLEQVGEGKWAKVTPEEEKAIIESITGHNMVVAAERGNRHTAYRHYVDRGYIVVHDMGGAADPHPLDVAK